MERQPKDNLRCMRNTFSILCVAASVLYRELPPILPSEFMVRFIYNYLCYLNVVDNNYRYYLSCQKSENIIAMD